MKNVTINEPFFQGHFQGHPIMPGVLQLEAIAQVAGILMLNMQKRRPTLLLHVSSVRWRKPVLPNDCMVIDVKRPEPRQGRRPGGLLCDGRRSARPK